MYIYHGVYMEFGALRHLVVSSTGIPKINMLHLLSEQFNFKPKCIPLIVVGGRVYWPGDQHVRKESYELHVIVDNICT